MFCFLIQASSVSWSGDKDDCMADVEGKPAVYWTVKRVYDNFAGAEVAVVAPEFDRGGALEELKLDFPALQVLYSHDDNPLSRMIEAVADMDEDSYFVRTNGLNLFFDVEAVKEMAALMNAGDVDCVKFPDDYPVHYTSELYRVASIRTIAGEIDKIAATDSERASFYRVHPRFLFFRLDRYNAVYIEGNLPYSDEFMRRSREVGQMVLKIQRQHLITDKCISAGDLLGYHYEIASKWISDGDRVLDIACGDGFGTEIIAERDVTITGADIDKEAVEEARLRIRPKRDNMNFDVQDVLALTYADSTFDVVLSMETIEHIPGEERYLEEIRRVLRPGGRLVLSTPQNSFGAVPFVGIHLKEYSLDELKSLVSKYFEIEHVIGFKAGRVYFEDDPIGTNTLMVLRKS
ncbi:MAG: class I SAM-dependent methyltransferase [Proteobacteria bacterium]|nr:class I SAM-dependent methyltransferase [Pseudomonadota bacterium]